MPKRDVRSCVAHASHLYLQSSMHFLRVVLLVALRPRLHRSSLEFEPSLKATTSEQSSVNEVPLSATHLAMPACCSGDTRQKQRAASHLDQPGPKLIPPAHYSSWLPVRKGMRSDRKAASAPLQIPTRNPPKFYFICSMTSSLRALI